ncbi:MULTISPECIES: hypothetical protein [unclassified Streptomyces]|uniref:hypothetical protein n=1 Tax=unclassified Streptomyces TaxID=2593676 RepID=UPI002E2BA56C|nr:hypothetical protein [Streptomyces sp. NBC_00228]
MSSGVISALGVAFLALLGTIYTGVTSRAAAREQQRVPTFESITKRLDDERQRHENKTRELEERLSVAERSQRILLSYVRDLREALRRTGVQPPPPPPDLDLSPWDDLN